MSSPGTTFYFDLASPLAYIVAERIGQALPGAEWRPVLARELPGASGTGPGPNGVADVGRAEIERLAAEAGLLPVRWPRPFPFDSEMAMLTATYAKSIGRTVAFAQASFRQAFAGGRDLAREDYLLIAAAACELHPRAVLAGAASVRIRGQLRETTADAAKAGAMCVPALRIGDQVFNGIEALERVPDGRTKAPDGRARATDGQVAAPV